METTPLRKEKPYIHREPTLLPKGMVFGNGTFPDAVNLLDREGFDVISIPEAAERLVEEGSGSFLPLNTYLVREGAVYFPDGRRILTRSSPILDQPGEAALCHVQDREYFPPVEAVEEALRDSVPLPQDSKYIKTRQFGEDELTVFAFGGGDAEKARTYGNFLRDEGITMVPIHVVDPVYAAAQPRAFARQPKLHNLVTQFYESAILGEERNVCSNCPVGAIARRSSSAGF